MSERKPTTGRSLVHTEARTSDLEKLGAVLQELLAAERAGARVAVESLGQSDLRLIAVQNGAFICSQGGSTHVRNRQDG